MSSKIPKLLKIVIRTIEMFYYIKPYSVFDQNKNEIDSTHHSVR